MERKNKNTRGGSPFARWCRDEAIRRGWVIDQGRRTRYRSHDMPIARGSCLRVMVRSELRYRSMIAINVASLVYRISGAGNWKEKVSCEPLPPAWQPATSASLFSDNLSFINIKGGRDGGGRSFEFYGSKGLSERTGSFRWLRPCSRFALIFRYDHAPPLFIPSSLLHVCVDCSALSRDFPHISSLYCSPYGFVTSNDAV